MSMHFSIPGNWNEYSCIAAVASSDRSSLIGECMDLEKRLLLGESGAGPVLVILNATRLAVFVWLQHIQR